jgi:hypothetical protein
MVVWLSALHTGRPLPPGRFLILISVTGWVGLRAILQLEGLGQLKNPMTSQIFSLNISTAAPNYDALFLKHLPPDLHSYVLFHLHSMAYIKKLEVTYTSECSIMMRSTF